MRFAMLVYPDPKAEAPGATPSAELIAAMTKYNEELAKAGALIALDGFHPSADGARVSFGGGEPMVAQGPFTDGRVVGGYWMIKAASKDEAVAWAKRAPMEIGDMIEVRQVQEIEDFPADARAAAQSDIVAKQIGR